MADSNAKPALGPGDDDPKSPAKGEAKEPRPALGPGDDVPAARVAPVVDSVPVEPAKSEGDD